MINEDGAIQTDFDVFYILTPWTGTRQGENDLKEK